jgi:hypothetical protein
MLSETEQGIVVNLQQQVLITTEDKIRLCLGANLAKMERRKDWIAPLGVVVAIVATLVSADFKSSLSLEGGTWKAIFIVALVLAVGWLVRCLRMAGASPSLDKIIVELGLQVATTTTRTTTSAVTMTEEAAPGGPQPAPP